MEMSLEVVNVILQCKKDICGNHKLFENILDFCAALDECLKQTKDSQLLLSTALNQFDEERESGSDTYSNTLNELKCFRAAGDPFTDEYFFKYQSVFQQHTNMLQKLQQRKYQLDEKLKSVNAWRKVSNVIFMSAAVCSIPIGSVEKWVNSLWENYEKASEGQNVIINSMRVATYVAVKDLETVRVLVERLEIDIASMLNNAELATEEGALQFRIAGIRKRFRGFITNIENLVSHADACSRDIRKARTVILQRIVMKKPNNK